ncbi:hypothetical protein HNQ50_001789 [Silvimonas terrae]|uniref:GIY-YIG domain-containing protein n=1 Tax=Silvimonas terrae TaxID=300266 RepID=A0A840RFA1_9NEIS|nr:hypothetical protein [Silvimonas terrae]MBB5191066.1 hypothetical protein [Silvimonas terrae]
MFKTAEGETLELAPWRMRRLLRLIADTRHYPAGTPPHTLIQDLRQIIARARRSGGNPRIGTRRYESKGTCCQACLLAQQRRDVLELVGLSIAGVGEFETELNELNELETAPRSANVALQWQGAFTLPQAVQSVGGPGVYVLMRNGQPVYVGMANSLAARLRQHAACAAQHQDGGLNVYTANISNLAWIPAVEHTLVRALGRRVSNLQLQQPLSVGPDGLSISNLLPPGITSPRISGNALRLNPGAQFEWSP